MSDSHHAAGRIFVAPALLLAAAGIAWAIRLVFGTSALAQDAAGLGAAGLVLLHTVFAVGATLATSRWVATGATLLLGVDLLLANTLDVDVAWWVAVVAMSAAVILLWRRRNVEAMAGSVRPDRVPPPATALAISLASLPLLVSGTRPDGVNLAGWILAIFGVIVGWAYMRALIPALWAARIVLPALGIWATIGLEIGPAIAALAGVAIVVGLAWTPQALRAARPLTEQVAPVPILPEMVPPELLGQAGFDHRGRPRRESGR